jgi:methionyl-tRNA formyltransferase
MSGKRGHWNGKMKIVFFGTSSFGIEALRFLAKNHNVLLVFTNPPKEAGRGKKLTSSAIEVEALKLGLNVVHSSRPKIEELPNEFDVGVVVAYGAIISKSVLEKAKYGFLNIHPSDLPKFRGASPIERTLEAGETLTRVCVIKMTPRLDDGDVLSFRKYHIQHEETSLDLHKKFAQIGAEILPDAISSLVNLVQGEVQDNSKTTYASKISKEELELTSNLTTMQAINKIRAFASYGYCFFFYNGKRIKVVKAEASKIRNTPLDLELKDGFISPILIKPEGKNLIQVRDFLNSR